MRISIGLKGLSSGLFVVLCAGIYADAQSYAGNSLDIIVSDMRNDSEAVPHGVPKHYGWPLHPRVTRGNVPPSGYRAIVAWGQVYEAQERFSAPNTRVEIRDMSLLILGRSTRQWQCKQYSRGVFGNAFVENFFLNKAQKAEMRKEPDGGISVVAGHGYNFHFWPDMKRASVDPDDIVGILVTFYARLILANPSQPDDRNVARYVASAGADYWRDLTVPVANDTIHGEVGIGRFKIVTKQWRAFHMTTLSADTLRANPPPDPMIACRRF